MHLLNYEEANQICWKKSWTKIVNDYLILLIRDLPIAQNFINELVHLLWLKEDFHILKFSKFVIRFNKLDETWPKKYNILQFLYILFLFDIGCDRNNDHNRDEPETLFVIFYSPHVFTAKLEEYNRNTGYILHSTIVVCLVTVWHNHMFFYMPYQKNNKMTMGRRLLILV